MVATAKKQRTKGTESVGKFIRNLAAEGPVQGKTIRFRERKWQRLEKLAEANGYSTVNALLEEMTDRLLEEEEKEISKGGKR